MLVERQDETGTTRILIDASPDLRAQLLDTGVGWLDGVLFTHQHADHMHGLDDLRMIVFNRRSRLPVWADAPTTDALISRFGYAFVQPEGSPYPPILDLKPINGPVSVDGAGGPIDAIPFDVEHGSIDSLGFRIGPLVYLPDVSEMSDAGWQTLEGAECWVVDALRYAPHPTHAHLERTLGWIEQSKVPRAVLTNMHIDLDHATVTDETPAHVEAAFDGMVLTYEI